MAHNECEGSWFKCVLMRNPVRVASLIITIVVIAVSVWTDVPLPKLLAEVAAIVAVLEKARGKVTPYPPKPAPAPKRKPERDNGQGFV